MRINVMDVTPEMADQWLGHNIRNRIISEKAKDGMVRDMLSGNWTSNGEPLVRLSKTNVILDGQHRLKAICESGVTLRDQIVIEDLDDDVQSTIDIGRKRTTADALVLSGEAYATVLAAVNRKAWQWDQGNLKFTSTTMPTTQEQLEYLEKNPSLRRSAEIAKRSSNHFRLIRPAVAGVAHHLFLRISPDHTALFFAKLETGAGLDEGDPILALRDRLTRDKLTSRSVPFHLGTAIYIRAWNAMREDRALSRIVHTAEEPMILPL